MALNDNLNKNINDANNNLSLDESRDNQFKSNINSHQNSNVKSVGKLVGKSDHKSVGKSNGKSIPTKIRSEFININRQNQTVEFNDNVIVEKEDSSLLADKMIVIYEEKKSNELNSKQTKIKRIDAYNHVKIFSDDSTATADNGYFDPEKNIFVLQKNVMVNNGTSIANGDKFIYNLTTKKGNFIGKQNEISSNQIIDENNSSNKNDDRVMVIIGDDIKDLKKSKKKNEQKNSQSQ